MIFPSMMLRNRQSAGKLWRNAASCSMNRAFSSVLAEDPLHIRDGARLEQRQTEQYAGLLRVLVERGDEPELVVLELDVAADHARGDARRPHADDPLLGLLGQGLDGRFGEVAVADAGDH